MASKVGLAAICCALGTAVKGNPSLDVAELVQSSVRTQGLDGSGALEAKDGPAFQISSEAVAQGLLHAVLSDGRRWAQLLWGNKTLGLDPEPVPIQGEATGCSEEDRKAETERVHKIRQDMFGNMQRMLPKMMQEAQKAQRAASRAPAVRVKVNGGGPELAINIGDLIDLPAACTDLGAQGNDLHWEGITSCAREFFGVSAACVNCIPDFGKQIQEGCVSTCRTSVADLSDTMDSEEVAMEEKLKKRQKSSFAPSLGPSDMLEVMQALRKAMSDGAKKLVPCAECVLPKGTSFARCMAGDAVAQAVEKHGGAMIKQLKNGDLLPMEIIPTAPRGPPTSSQKAIPL